MTVLVATSVVRGSNQGESHGGVYLIDLERQRVSQCIDWNDSSIDWQGRGWDRGLRGIAFDDDRVFVAASDELYVYNPEFELIASYRCAYLKHCHEIFAYKRRLFLTSTGFDSILGFDLDDNRFSMGLHIAAGEGQLLATPYDPNDTRGPAAGNALHINNVYCNQHGMFVGGRGIEALLVYGGQSIKKVAPLPAGTHNARPFKGGVLFNDSESDVVRYAKKDKQRVFQNPRYPDEQLTNVDFDDSRIARQSFGRGLCMINDHVIAAGSSPSTITLHNLQDMKSTLSINLTMDVRNAVHGLEVWPYPV
jgi:hypothetical protein